MRTGRRPVEPCCAASGGRPEKKNQCINAFTVRFTSRCSPPNLSRLFVEGHESCPAFRSVLASFRVEPFAGRRATDVAKRGSSTICRSEVRPRAQVLQCQRNRSRVWVCMPNVDRAAKKRTNQSMSRAGSATAASRSPTGTPVARFPQADRALTQDFSGSRLVVEWSARRRPAGTIAAVNTRLERAWPRARRVDRPAGGEIPPDFAQWSHPGYRSTTLCIRDPILAGEHDWVGRHK